MINAQINRIEPLESSLDINRRRRASLKVNRLTLQCSAFALVVLTMLAAPHSAFAFGPDSLCRALRSTVDTCYQDACKAEREADSKITETYLVCLDNAGIVRPIELPGGSADGKCEKEFQAMIDSRLAKTQCSSKCWKASFGKKGAGGRDLYDQCDDYCKSIGLDFWCAAPVAPQKKKPIRELSPEDSRREESDVTADFEEGAAIEAGREEIPLF